MKLLLEHVGYFVGTSQVPEYDPPKDSPCPLCGLPCNSSDQSVSNLKWHLHMVDVLGEPGLGLLSLFYRAHRSCVAKDPAHAAMADFLALAHGRTIAMRRLS
jgi:hypothetical protein